LARSFAIFNVDEIVIFNELGMQKNSQPITSQIDSHTKSKREEGISSDPNVFLARILQYLETPQLVTFFFL
jgi:predicted SPOUT superfamily RNA methylase MTH1